MGNWYGYHEQELLDCKLRLGGLTRGADRWPGCQHITLQPVHKLHKPHWLERKQAVLCLLRRWWIIKMHQVSHTKALCWSIFVVMIVNILHRKRATKVRRPECTMADYIGISGKVMFCGTKQYVESRCHSNKKGYVIINRANLDAGEVVQSYLRLMTLSLNKWECCWCETVHEDNGITEITLTGVNCWISSPKYIPLSFAECLLML